MGADVAWRVLYEDGTMLRGGKWGAHDTRKSYTFELLAEDRLTPVYSWTVQPEWRLMWRARRRQSYVGSPDGVRVVPSVIGPSLCIIVGVERRDTLECLGVWVLTPELEGTHIQRADSWWNDGVVDASRPVPYETE